MPRYLLFFILFCGVSFAQEITSFQQFNGRYDYTAIGNTLNPAENNLDGSFCFPLTSSSASLNLDASNEIIAAYLFWAGSGIGDTNVTLNDTDFEADTTFNVDYIESSTSTLTYFSCVKEITDFIINEGNVDYTLSNLDVSDALIANPRYCQNRTNFAGWSIYVIYQNDNLALNQVNLFLGLDIINRTETEKTIIIDNLNVLDNDNAKIGFLAWEGDNALNFGETLSINGNVLSSLPLNSSDNAFNGTNSFTGSTDFYNGDLDFYNIEDNISPGDTQAEIRLTTGDFDIFGQFRADLIILNNIITVLNSQVPDATITLDNYNQECNNLQIEVDYTVSNVNSTEILPANVPIAFYADDILIGQTITNQAIPIGESLAGSILLNLPPNITDNYILTIVIDDDGQGNSTVIEISESNNTSITNQIALPLPEEIDINVEAPCPLNNEFIAFNLNQALSNTIQNSYLNYKFYESLQDLELDINEFLNTEDYTPTALPSTLYVYAEKNVCFDIIIINLTAEDCPPIIPQGISPNGDGLNDNLNISFLGLNNPNYDIQIFNRYGTLVYKGNQSKNWNGTSNRGSNKYKILPTGTYYYILEVLTENRNTFTGWIYLTK